MRVRPLPTGQPAVPVAHRLVARRRIGLLAMITVPARAQAHSEGGARRVALVIGNNCYAAAAAAALEPSGFSVILKTDGRPHELPAHIAAAQQRIDEIVTWGDGGTDRRPDKPSPLTHAARCAAGERRGPMARCPGCPHQGHAIKQAARAGRVEKPGRCKRESNAPLWRPWA